ncbi:hypothetical protein J2795_001011 [Chryseobacterium bernardetii]|uniref:Uncharacterized protein n=2 Tax=Chryseobacterium TaxID=59732 RepID=A0A543ELA4_9FLAO|nr:MULTISPECIES: hypothetical protein [Chryseobacterium]MDR6368751.1 hypothetical protein [Chryseobacterium vietnamense]MDR6440326.1 hypothetical protein [Chryseobacterium bernardetii]TQM22363.1 hypothetical protein FB551_2075 [Chryseobacterium aquifrigidense]
MITNIPEYEDFEKVAKECLIQALESLFNIYCKYKEYDDKNITEEVPLNEVWEHNKPTFRTSIILLHQGIETYMKSIIVRNSPYLLLEQKRSEWPSLPESKNVDYSAMYTFAGENLLHTFCTVTNGTLTTEKIKFIEDIRQNRNKAIHGAGNILNDPNTVIIDILKAYTYFFGKDQWFNDIKKWNESNPLFGYYDWSFESTLSYKFLDFLEATIGIKKINSFLNFDLSGRRYLCPTCFYEMNSKGEKLLSKWALLSPNKPSSKLVHCINCDFESEIERINCHSKNCIGNVIDMDGICLTCGEKQEIFT